MENKLNYSAIDNYCEKYAASIIDQWFENHESITGKEILELTPSKQINLFILKNLFFEWKNEAERLRSDYFNYKADSVKSALKSFMNELSQNILIGKEAFVPLLNQSVRDAVLLIVSPYDFYENEINHPQRNKLKLSYLQELRKYVKINRSLLDAVISAFEKEGISKAFNDEAMRIFQDAFNQFEGEPADVSDYLNEFNAVTPLDLTLIYEGSNQPEAAPDPIERPVVSNDDDDRPTLNDTFQEIDKTTLADELQYTKIENLKDSLSVNQKFMFINKLFAGDSAMFHEALNKIETLGSREDALNLLEMDYSPYKEWDHESDEVVEFFELLERRFK